MFVAAATCSQCGGDIEVVGTARQDDGLTTVDLVALIPFHDCDRPTLAGARGGHGDHP